MTTVIAMVGAVAGVWGLFGGFAVSGLELQALLRSRGRWPWQSAKGEPPEISRSAYLTGEIVRLLVGAGLAWAAAATGQISGPLGAVGIGAAAPFILDQLSRGTLSRGHAAAGVESDKNPGITRGDPKPRPDPQAQE